MSLYLSWSNFIILLINFSCRILFVARLATPQESIALCFADSSSWTQLCRFCMICVQWTRIRIDWKRFSASIVGQFRHLGPSRFYSRPVTYNWHLVNIYRIPLFIFNCSDTRFSFIDFAFHGVRGAQCLSLAIMYAEMRFFIIYIVMQKI